MADAEQLKIGTLGGMATFAGEAARYFGSKHPEYAAPLYFPSMEACWQALNDNAIDVLFIGIERTGQPHTGREILVNGLYVVGWAALPLACNLYVKPGTKPGDIKKITGHGSIHQCTSYLDANYPGVPREAHGLNSVEAARAVAAGDGTLAVVGSRSLPNAVPGLEMIASNIDSGAISSWWAMARQPNYATAPEILVVGLRCGPDGSLGRVVAALQAVGFGLRTAASFPVNRGVSTYDYLLTFSGNGKLTAVQKALSAFADTRLIGAFVEDK